MIVTYHLHEQELTVDVLNSIKVAFEGKNIKITVSEAMDETAYLLSSKDKGATGKINART